MLKGIDVGSAEERKKIGELLVEAEVITKDQLQKALDSQREKGGRLCYNLIRLGAIRANDLLEFLSEQFGVAAVNLDLFKIDNTVLNRVPREFARSQKLIPLHLLDNTLTVAMVDPGQSEIIEKLQDVTGLEVDPLIAPEATIQNAVDTYYGPLADEDAAELGGGVLALGDEKEERHLYLASPPPDGYSPEDWIKRFFLQAIKRRCRQIHLEPVEKGLRARFRVGERLFDGETAPVGMRRKILSRALGLARIDPEASAAGPMEGRMRISVRKRSLRVTLSSFPTLYGERLVLQIMDEGLLGRDLQELGMSREVADETSRILRIRNGLLLVNAPPSQGKRTTFYSLLNHIRDEGGRNIMTLEYPIQYPLAEISQTQISFGKGVDFYYGLKSLLRQNPDVIGLTDINDCRTLEMVFSAARECLVIGLCNFWDNLQGLEWIAGCGIGATTQAHLIRGLLSQRLVPRICSHCRENLETPPDLIEGVRDKRPEELRFHTGRGCERCGETGRSGRLGVFELLSFRFALRDLLARGTELQIVYEEAQRQGMWTMREDGILKATQGLVDVRDVLEATGEEGAED